MYANVTYNQTTLEARRFGDSDFGSHVELPFVKYVITRFKKTPWNFRAQSQGIVSVEWQHGIACEASWWFHSYQQLHGYRRSCECF